MPGGWSALLRAILLWSLFIVLESGQGVLRRLLLKPQVQLLAREVGVLIGAALIFGLTWLAWENLKLRSRRAALATGLSWAALTAGFDLGVGRLLGASWTELAQDYDPRRGGWMAGGLLAMAATPWIVGQLKRDRGFARPGSTLGGLAAVLAGVLAIAGVLASAPVTAARANPAGSVSQLVWFTQQSLRSRDDALALLGMLGLIGGAVTVIVVATAQLISTHRSRVDPPQGEVGADGVFFASGRRTGSARRKAERSPR